MRVKKTELVKNLIHEIKEPYTLYVKVKGNLDELKMIQKKFNEVVK